MIKINEVSEVEDELESKFQLSINFSLQRPINNEVLSYLKTYTSRKNTMENHNKKNIYIRVFN